MPPATTSSPRRYVQPVSRCTGLTVDEVGTLRDLLGRVRANAATILAG